MLRTGNPVFTKSDSFQEPAQTWGDLDAQGRGFEAAPTATKPTNMTIQGTVNKSAFLLAICTAAAVGAFVMGDKMPGLLYPAFLVSMVGSIICTIAMCKSPGTAFISAPILGVLEGIMAGSVSYIVASFVPAEQAEAGLNHAIIFNALLLTFGIFGGMLLGYTTGLIKAGPGFRKFVVTATIGVGLYALVSIGASLFGFHELGALWRMDNGGMLSIGFSIFVVGLATANLVLDFDFIENAVRSGSPKAYEWVGAGGLLVTLVWLYIEVLRLMAKLANRD